MVAVLKNLRRKPLSFHAVSFGQDSESSHLRRMVQIALDIQNNAPHDPLTMASATVLSSYSRALDTVGIDFCSYVNKISMLAQNRSDLRKRSLE